MSSPRSRSVGVLAAAALVILGVGPLAVVAPAQAAVDGSGIVISEVYLSGGSAGATYQNKYVELYNPTDHAIDVSTLSIQYRSATGTGSTTGVTALDGEIGAGKHYLVQGGSNGANGASLPSPDASGSVNPSGTAGVIVLARQTTALTIADLPTGNSTSNAKVVDLVGYGPTANTFETAPAPGGPGVAASLNRSAPGTDTDTNSADFTSAAPSPEGTCSGVDPTPVAASIEEVQGTGNNSPLVCRTVTTHGVVTAAYPTGGFNGFYVQETADQAGDPDASDGVFVFSPSEVSEVAIGDYVEVTARVSEFGGLTELGPTSNGVAVQPLPDGATPPAATAVAFPDNDADREALEGMVLDPQGSYTVGDTFDLNAFAEIGLAAGDHPLVTPTEVADAQDPAAIAAAQADIEARQLALDDGSSINFLSTANGGANKDIPLPWLATDNQVRTGAAVTFHDDVILDFRNGSWKFQPTGQVTGSGSSVATFENTRTPAPAEVGGDLRIASFNVLNYFTETAADWVAAGHRCTYFDDRDGNHITANTCDDAADPTLEGPRGAAEDANLARQQAKIVAAINHLGANVVSLEEIENSAHFGPDRDAALSTLVDALNADAGSDVWAFAPTPADAGDQTDEDVIRTAFIYQPASVEPVGPSVILQDDAFDNARDPLAQGFHPVGGPSASRFVAIVNHFKSKGSGVDDGTGQGLANPDRVAQAHALVGFANQMKSAVGTDKVFLTGDFNSYTQEDPLQVLYDAGYTDIGSALHPDEYTYVFDGFVGSLDHVLANDAAMDRVTGAHVWNINSVESVALEYSRYNYNATLFYEPTPYRASDHDPLVVGFDVPSRETTTTVTAPSTVALKERPSIEITVTGSPGASTPSGAFRILQDGVQVATGLLVDDGHATVSLAPAKKKGRHTVTVEYLGDADHDPSAGTTSYTVVKR